MKIYLHICAVVKCKKCEKHTIYCVFTIDIAQYICYTVYEIRVRDKCALVQIMLKMGIFRQKSTRARRAA